LRPGITMWRGSLKLPKTTQTWNLGLEWLRGSAAPACIGTY
jgi:hypothetical protein